MVIFVLGFLSGGFFGMVLMIILAMGKREDVQSSKMYSHIGFAYCNPNHTCSSGDLIPESE
jgi:hypothetical protein